MLRLKVLLFACVLSTVASHQPSLVQVVTKPPLRLKLEKGAVEENTYKNASLGLELTPAPGLKFGTPQMKGTLGTAPLIVTIAAQSEKGFFSETESTVFYADALAYYPEDQRSTEAYVKKLTRANIRFGYMPISSVPNSQLGGVSFFRSDFRKDSKYEVVFIKSCDVYAFVFAFVGADVDAVDSLVLGTKVKLDLRQSGCVN